MKYEPEPIRVTIGGGKVRAEVMTKHLSYSFRPEELDDNGLPVDAIMNMRFNESQGCDAFMARTLEKRYI